MLIRTDHTRLKVDLCSTYVLDRTVKLLWTFAVVNRPPEASRYIERLSSHNKYRGNASRSSSLPCFWSCRGSPDGKTRCKTRSGRAACSKMLIIAMGTPSRSVRPCRTRNELVFIATVHATRHSPPWIYLSKISLHVCHNKDTFTFSITFHCNVSLALQWFAILIMTCNRFSSTKDTDAQLAACESRSRPRPGLTGSLRTRWGSRAYLGAPHSPASLPSSISHLMTADKLFRGTHCDHQSDCATLRRLGDWRASLPMRRQCGSSSDPRGQITFSSCHTKHSLRSGLQRNEFVSPSNRLLIDRSTRTVRSTMQMSTWHPKWPF